MPDKPVTTPRRPAAPARRRSRLPRTGPNARWPQRATTAARVAVYATGFLLVVGFGLAAWSPPRFQRLTQLYGSLPVAVLMVVLFSGVTYFLLDAVRRALPGVDADPWRRRLLLGQLGLWLVLTVALAVALLWYPALRTFGTLP